MTKLCTVIIEGLECEAVFYGVFQKAYTYAGGMSIGSAPAGQVSFPVAVVNYGDGLKEVSVDQVKELTKDD